MSYAEELIEKGRQEAMSYAEKLIQEGEQRGEQRGVYYARQETAIEMLRDANSLDKVVKYTHLSLEEVKDLQKKILH